MLNLFKNIVSKIKLKIRICQRHRHFYHNMECPILLPNESVRGMTKLNRMAFTKTIKVPTLKLMGINFNKIFPHLKKIILKMEHLKPVQGDNIEKKILLHPMAVKCWNDLPIDVKEFNGINETNFMYDDLTLTYENWRGDEILKSVIPEGSEGLSSFSRMGHLVHLNLKDHLLEYKQLIGEVLKDKIVGCRTVVTKAKSIDNTYRTFEMELLCGEPDYRVSVKENGILFDFDFSAVYWNSRLSSEHERIVQMLNSGDVLYDIMAGVGPFSIPAAKKNCQVLANDLNPESFKWLLENAKKNKVGSSIRMFNKDGRDFITKDIKEDLIKRWQVNDTDYKIHIAMNLPAMAVEFLDAFRGLLISYTGPIGVYPLVHVYCFAKGEEKKDVIAKRLVEDNLGIQLNDNLNSINFVRNVAPNKDMMRVSFYLTSEILFTNFDNKRRSSNSQCDQTPHKKQCNF